MYAAFVFLASNWALVTAVVLVVVVLGFAAFVLKNWKIAAAAILIVAGIYGGQWLFTAGVNAEVAREKARIVATLQNRIDIANSIADAAAERALKDATKIEELEKAASETPKNDGICLDAAAADRVRNIR